MGITWLTIFVGWEIFVLPVIGLVGTKLKTWYYYFIIYLPLMYFKYLSINFLNKFFNISYSEDDGILKGLAIMLYLMTISLGTIYLYTRITKVTYWKYVLLSYLTVHIFFLLTLGYLLLVQLDREYHLQ